MTTSNRPRGALCSWGGAGGAAWRTGPRDGRPWALTRDGVSSGRGAEPDATGTGPGSPGSPPRPPHSSPPRLVPALLRPTARLPLTLNPCLGVPSNVPLEGPCPHAPAGSWPSPAVPASPAGLPCGGHIPSTASAPWAWGWGTALLPLWLSPRNKPPQARRPQSQLGTFVLSRGAAGWRGEFPVWAGPGRPLLGSLSSPGPTGAWLVAGGSRVASAPA